jgi:phosphotransferase system  glucose/maltose/N-acetylglucosamine-specific IIC component
MITVSVSTVIIISLISIIVGLIMGVVLWEFVGHTLNMGRSGGFSRNGSG